MQDKFETVEQLRSAMVAGGQMPVEWTQKMVHKVPNIPTVKDRKRYLIEKSKDKVVLDIGCTGHISKAIRAVAKKYYGVDKSNGGDWAVVDIDHRPDMMPKYEDVEIVVLSEVLEHLANPGYFLLALKEMYAGKTIYITVPNAGAYVVKDDCEIVNKDHVCWYSYTTLHNLLTRYGFEVRESRWYNGQPYKAEGLIMVVT